MPEYYRDEDLERFGEIGKYNPELFRKFMDWYNMSLQPGMLSKREKVLIGLAVAHAVQCPYCIDAYTRNCLEEGMSLGHVTEAVHVASAVRGGASLIHGIQAHNSAGRMSLQGMVAFDERIAGVLGRPLFALGIDVLQVNLGYRCNMSCKHCHVEAGPGRTEAMDARTAEDVVTVLRNNDIGILDITGGAPELNSNFGRLVEDATKLGRHVLVRTNLTIFFEEGKDYLPEFYRDHGVEIIASFPYYLEEDVDRVRGVGTFRRCLAAVERLNSLGYGLGSADLRLNFVYNPPGAFLAADQKTLEEDFKRELAKRFGIGFDNLYVFANVPIGRFRTYLIRSGNLERYAEKLTCAFNPGTVDGLMCRHLVSVGWNGMIYDCDFNQILGLGVGRDCPQHIRDFDYSGLAGREISVGEHCHACTAGQGST